MLRWQAIHTLLPVIQMLIVSERVPENVFQMENIRCLYGGFTMLIHLLDNLTQVGCRAVQSCGIYSLCRGGTSIMNSKHSKEMSLFPGNVLPGGSLFWLVTSRFYPFHDLDYKTVSVPSSPEAVSLSPASEHIGKG